MAVLAMSVVFLSTSIGVCRAELGRRDAIEVSVAPSIQASPKNDYGRLNRDVAERVVRRFFAREFAWQPAASGEPIASAVLGADRAGRGLSARDVVSAIEFVERTTPSVALPSEQMLHETRERCDALQTELIGISYQGTGRVAVGALLEHEEQRKAGLRAMVPASVVESPAGKQPHVLLANYLSASLHCDKARGDLKTGCCVSPCEHLMHVVESELQAPIASPDRLLQAIQAATLSVAELPRRMKMQLHAIAEQHDGVVPLHSDSFAKWLHYAYPNVCPLTRSIAVGQQELELTPDLVKANVSQPYSVSDMLTEYLGESAEGDAITTGWQHWNPQDAGRVAITALIGAATLHTALSYLLAARSSFKDAPEESELKKAAEVSEHTVG